MLYILPTKMAETDIQKRVAGSSLKIGHLCSSENQAPRSLVLLCTEGAVLVFTGKTFIVQPLGISNQFCSKLNISCVGLGHKKKVPLLKCAKQRAQITASEDIKNHEMEAEIEAPHHVRGDMYIVQGQGFDERHQITSCCWNGGSLDLMLKSYPPDFPGWMWRMDGSKEKACFKVLDLYYHYY